MKSIRNISSTIWGFVSDTPPSFIPLFELVDTHLGLAGNEGMEKNIEVLRGFYRDIRVHYGSCSIVRGLSRDLLGGFIPPFPAGQR